MRQLMFVLLAAALPLAAVAQEVAAAAPEAGIEAEAEAEALAEPEILGTPERPLDGSGVTLDDFLWTARPLVIFADNTADPSFQRQMELLRSRPEPLSERDVLVIVDTNPREASDLRRSLRPRGFSMVLLGKDGRVIQRKPSPWDVREITRAIDRTPQGQQEIQERLRGGS
jgi:hypothetical protein